MKRLLYLAALVVVATLAFAPAALAQQEGEVDLSCDTYPPEPGCEEGGSTGNPTPSANPNDPADLFNNVIDQAQGNAIDCQIGGPAETADAAGDISSDTINTPNSLLGLLTWVPKFVFNLFNFFETGQEAANNPACSYYPG